VEDVRAAGSGTEPGAVVEIEERMGADWDYEAGGEGEVLDGQEPSNAFGNCSSACQNRLRWRYVLSVWC